MIKLNRKKFKFVALAAGTLSVAASTAAMAGYPEKPVKVVVGFSAGGGTDTSARGFASYMHETSTMDGMAGVVINKPGSSGLIGAKIVKDAKSDAYTLYAINIGTFTVADIAQTVTKGKSPVGPRDFRPLGCFSQLITGMQVHKSDPANNAKEWAENAKKSGEVVRWASTGATTLHSILGIKWLNEMGIKHKLVPFKGGSKTRNAIIAQKLPMAFNGIHLNIGFENDLKTIGIAALERDKVKKNKNYPTFKELGTPPLGITGLMCLFAPKDIPEDRAKRLEIAIKEISEIKGFAKYMGKAGLATFYVGPQEAAAAIDKMYTTFEPIVRAALKK